MNRKALKFDVKNILKIVFIVAIVAGIVLMTNGLLQLKTYSDKIGGTTIDEAIADTNDVEAELGRLSQERADELVNNGYSDRFYEIFNQEQELKAKNRDALDRKYALMTGYHNPTNLGDSIKEAPTLLYGLLLIASGIAGFIVLRVLNLKERAAAKKAE